jgi:hypothetical protein
MRSVFNDAATALLFCILEVITEIFKIFHSPSRWILWYDMTSKQVKILFHSQYQPSWQYAMYVVYTTWTLSEHGKKEFWVVCSVYKYATLDLQQRFTALLAIFLVVKSTTSIRNIMTFRKLFAVHVSWNDIYIAGPIWDSSKKREDISCGVTWWELSHSALVNLRCCVSCGLSLWSFTVCGFLMKGQ